MTLEEKKKKGDFICKPGKEHLVFHPNVRRVHCAPYAIKGQYCENPEECKRANTTHVPFYKWKEEHKRDQVAWVEGKQDCVRFNKECVRPHNLPEEKRHLLGNGA